VREHETRFQILRLLPAAAGATAAERAAASPAKSTATAAETSTAETSTAPAAAAHSACDQRTDPPAAATTSTAPGAATTIDHRVHEKNEDTQEN
jgi:hypothetical protein